MRLIDCHAHLWQAGHGFPWIRPGSEHWKTFTLDDLEGALGTAAELAERHPGLTVVVNHLGNPRRLGTGDLSRWEYELRLAAARPNVMLKISGLLTQQYGAPEARVRALVERAVTTIGPARCLVGSDWPICVPRGTRADSLSLALRGLAGLSDAERAQVLHGNAVRAYRLGGNPDGESFVIDSC